MVNFPEIGARIRTVEDRLVMESLPDGVHYTFHPETETRYFFGRAGGDLRFHLGSGRQGEYSDGRLPVEAGESKVSVLPGDAKTRKRSARLPTCALR
jgi:hypothetical protein